MKARKQKAKGRKRKDPVEREPRFLSELTPDQQRTAERKLGPNWACIIAGFGDQ